MPRSVSLQTRRLQVMAGIDNLGYAKQIGATDTVRLVAFRHRLDATAGRHDLKLAKALPKYDFVSAALPDPATPHHDTDHDTDGRPGRGRLRRRSADPGGILTRGGRLSLRRRRGAPGVLTGTTGQTLLRARRPARVHMALLVAGCVCASSGQGEAAARPQGEDATDPTSST
jgi:hypothetical protein